MTASRHATSDPGYLTNVGGTVYFEAYEPTNGRELWKFALPAGGKATPMTYLGADGRQFIVISAGGEGDCYQQNGDEC